MFYNKYRYLSLNMVSKQTINIWDRMGRPIVTDVERDVNELVTFCHVLPDPEWRGWMLMSKKNMHNVLQLPNSQVKSHLKIQLSQKFIELSLISY